MPIKEPFNDLQETENVSRKRFKKIYEKDGKTATHETVIFSSLSFVEGHLADLVCMKYEGAEISLRGDETDESIHALTVKIYLIPVERAQSFRAEVTDMVNRFRQPVHTKTQFGSQPT